MASSKERGQITIAPFDHKNEKGETRASRWKQWADQLRNSCASVFPFLAMQLRTTPDATLERFGLPFSEVHFDFSGPRGQKEAVKLFEISQWQLFSVLHKSFGTQETKLFQDYDPMRLIPLFKSQFGWDDDHENVQFLPFAILVHNAIAGKYSDTGISDALTKFDRWEKAKVFKTGKVEEWCSELENAYNEVQLSVHDREHLAALQVLHSVLNCGKDVWKTWAMSFATTQAKKPFTIARLVERVLAQYRLVQQKAGTSADEALLTDGPKGDHFQKRKVKNKDKKICNVPGCNTPVAKLWQSMCLACFKKNKNQQTADIPKATKKANIEKQKKKLAKRLAQVSKKAKEIEQAEANIASEDVSHSEDLDVEEEQPQDDNNTDESPREEKSTKLKKKVKKAVMAKKVIKKVSSGNKKLSSLPKPGKLGTVLKTASKAKKKKAKTSDASVLHAYDSSLSGAVVTRFSGSMLSADQL